VNKCGQSPLNLVAVGRKQYPYEIVLDMRMPDSSDDGNNRPAHTPYASISEASDEEDIGECFLLTESLIKAGLEDAEKEETEKKAKAEYDQSYYGKVDNGIKACVGWFSNAVGWTSQE